MSVRVMLNYIRLHYFMGFFLWDFMFLISAGQNNWTGRLRREAEIRAEEIKKPRCICGCWAWWASRWTGLVAVTDFLITTIACENTWNIMIFACWHECFFVALFVDNIIRNYSFCTLYWVPFYLVLPLPTHGRSLLHCIHDVCVQQGKNSRTRS